MDDFFFGIIDCSLLFDFMLLHEHICAFFLLLASVCLTGGSNNTRSFSLLIKKASLKIVTFFMWNIQQEPLFKLNFFFHWSAAAFVITTEMLLFSAPFNRHEHKMASKLKLIFLWSHYLLKLIFRLLSTVFLFKTMKMKYTTTTLRPGKKMRTH